MFVGINEDSFDACFEGIERNGVVAVSSAGQARWLFNLGLVYLTAKYHPLLILNLGGKPDDIIEYYAVGQRINIEIELHGVGNAVGKKSYIQSGWMIQPDESIKLNTPFAGFTR